MSEDKQVDRELVLGIGGIFVRSRDPKALADWYRHYLGFDVLDFGGAFGSIFPFAADEPGYQIWTAFPNDTDNFGDGHQPHMLNFRVRNLDALLAQLRADGASVEDKIEDSEFGKFGWCRDAEGNRIELWQPPEEENGSSNQG